MLKKLYVNLIMKTMTIPYVLLAIGIGFVLYLTLSTKIDVMQTFNGKYANGVVTISTTQKITVDKIYVYTDRNEKIYTVNISSSTYQNGTQSFKVASENSDFSDLPTIFSVDAATGQQSLFSTIFLKAGKN